MDAWKEERTYFAGVLRRAPASQQAFVAVVLLHVLFLLGERSYALLYAHVWYTGVDAADVQQDELWMWLIMVGTAAFMVWFSLEAVLKANAWEIGAFFGTSLFLSIRVIADYACFMSNNNENSDVLECGTPGLFGAVPHILFALALTLNIIEWVLCYIMVPELRWTKYKSIGSDVKVRTLYEYYELYSSVRKMDLQFSVALVLTALVFFSNRAADRATGLPPTLVLILLEVAWDRVGVMAVKCRSTWYMAAFWFLSAFLPLYVIIIGLVSFDQSNAFFDELRTGDEGQVRADRVVKVAVLAVACVGNRASSVIMSVILFRYFPRPEYGELTKLFDLGYTKYGKQRVSGAEGPQDVVNPIGEEGGHQGDVELGETGPMATSRPATVVEAQRAQGVRGKLARLYEGGGEEEPLPQAPGDSALSLRPAVVSPGGKARGQPPQPAAGGVATLPAQEGAGGGEGSLAKRDSDRLLLERIRAKKNARRG